MKENMFSMVLSVIMTFILLFVVIYVVRLVNTAAIQEYVTSPRPDVECFVVSTTDSLATSCWKKPPNEL